MAGVRIVVWRVLLWRQSMTLRHGFDVLESFFYGVFCGQASSRAVIGLNNGEPCFGSSGA